MERDYQAKVIRKKFHHGILTAFSSLDEIVIAVDRPDGTQTLYHWDENARSGLTGAIEHGGNFLHGTEYREPARSNGDWVQYPHHVEGGVALIVGSPLCYRSNFFPSFADIERAFTDGGNGWERTNPELGKNNEWIPYNPR